MSPRRGDRVTVPPPQDQWDVRFATGDAVTGWEELCRHALANTSRCLEILRTDPRSGAGHGRQHRLRGDLAFHRHNGKDLERPVMLTRLERPAATARPDFCQAQ